MKIGVVFPSGLVPCTGGEINMALIAAQLQQDGHDVFGICRPGPLQAWLSQRGIHAQIFPPFAPRDRAAYLHLAKVFFDAMLARQPLGEVLAAVAALPYVPQPFDKRQVFAHPFMEANFFVADAAPPPAPVLFFARDALRLWRAAYDVDVLFTDVAWDAACAVAAFGPERVTWYVQMAARQGWLDEYLLSARPRIVACGKGVKDERFPADAKVLAIANGVDTERFRPQSRHPSFAADALLVGCAGGLGKRKNQLALVEACVAALARSVNLHLYLFGRGAPEYESLLKEAARPLGDRFHLAGHVALDELLPSLDIFALPSNEEGLPLALCEAMACGVACIATDLPGCKELAGDDAAVIVPRGDVVALTEAIVALAASPEARRALGLRGRERVAAKFDQREMLRKFSELFA